MTSAGSALWKQVVNKLQENQKKSGAVTGAHIKIDFSKLAESPEHSILNAIFMTGCIRDGSNIEIIDTTGAPHTQVVGKLGDGHILVSQFLEHNLESIASFMAELQSIPSNQRTKDDEAALKGITAIGDLLNAAIEMLHEYVPKITEPEVDQNNNNLKNIL